MLPSGPLFQRETLQAWLSNWMVDPWVSWPDKILMMDSIYLIDKKYVAVCMYNIPNFW